MRKYLDAYNYVLCENILNSTFAVIVIWMLMSEVALHSPHMVCLGILFRNTAAVSSCRANHRLQCCSPGAATLRDHDGYR